MMRRSDLRRETREDGTPERRSIMAECGSPVTAADVVGIVGHPDTSKPDCEMVEMPLLSLPIDSYGVIGLSRGESSGGLGW